MEQAADFELQDTPRGRTAVLTGDWTAVDMGLANERLTEALRGAGPVAIDLTGIGRCDTSGAWGVLQAAAVNGEGGETGEIIAPPALERLFQLVRTAVEAEPTPTVRRRSLVDVFARIGRGVADIGATTLDTMVFNGHLLTATGRAIANPRRIRWASVFALAERAGLDAMPIVAVTSFFIGAVVGFAGRQSAEQVRGAGVLRGAGRRRGAARVQHPDHRPAAGGAIGVVLRRRDRGSMKMNQEIDAMQVLGVDPFDALVFPRFMALLLTIPLLTFVATLGGPGGRRGRDLVGARRRPDDLRPAPDRRRRARPTSGSACPRRRCWRR